MAIEFTPTTSPTGFEILDTNEQRRLQIRTKEAVSLRPSNTDDFVFPVDESYTIETSSLLLTQYYLPSIHNEEGVAQHSIESGDQFILSDRSNFIGLSAPIKFYCHASSPGIIDTSVKAVKISFEKPVEIEVGARSYHEQPIGTITTPDDPKTMMSAVSALSSALKTTSPEKTWPTLRGHPPLIRRGQELEIPSQIDPNKTDVSIEIPPDYRHLYTVAPLSFYLGAEIRPGEKPTLKTDKSTYNLGVCRRLEDDIARILKQIFLFDCIVRTEGIYRDKLYERSELEDRLPFDISRTYGERVSSRVDRYLSVDYELVDRYLPRWPLTAHIPSTPESIEIIPYIVNELGIIREPHIENKSVQGEDPSLNEGDVDMFVRSASTKRSPTILPTDEIDTRDLIQPPIDRESVEHAWFAEGVPIGASKATIEAYQNNLVHSPKNHSIEILVVCNDPRMLKEHDVLEETYGTRKSLPFDVTSRFGVSTTEMEELLTNGGYDYLHYIGHATDAGLQCMDGELDVRSISSVDIAVFFLNACRSYKQGLELARRGASGGIVTITDVINESAIEVGETVARLLDLGFPLRGALEIVRETNSLGNQYLIVGDGSTEVAQSTQAAPCIDIIERVDENNVQYSLRSYPTKDRTIGITVIPALDRSSRYSLLPGESPTQIVPQEEVKYQSSLSRTPLLIDGNLEWTDRFEVNQLF